MECVLTEVRRVDMFESLSQVRTVGFVTDRLHAGELSLLPLQDRVRLWVLNAQGSIHFPHALNFNFKASFTTIRTPTKVISGPFWPAESNRNLHLPIALLVVARVARTSPKSDGKKFRPKFLHHLVKHQQPTIRIAWRVLLDQFVAFNPPVASVCP